MCESATRGAARRLSRSRAAPFEVPGEIGGRDDEIALGAQIGNSAGLKTDSETKARLKWRLVVESGWFNRQFLSPAGPKRITHRAGSRFFATSDEFKPGAFTSQPTGVPRRPAQATARRSIAELLRIARVPRQRTHGASDPALAAPRIETEVAPKAVLVFLLARR